MSISDHRTYLRILQEGELRLEGEFLWGSNSTFFVFASLDELTLKAVYKPLRGERPLWDFPLHTLAKREVAAYLVSQALGWELVPPTVFRRKAPLGAGSIQLYIEHDPDYHFFTFKESDRQRLRPVVVFDLVVNNADRKGSHVLIDDDGHIWCIDHGICFHEEDKLRTVLWDFAGEPIPKHLVADLMRVRGALQNEVDWVQQLGAYLTLSEIAALQRRLERLIRNPIFPEPPEDRRPYPWPPI